MGNAWQKARSKQAREEAAKSDRRKKIIRRAVIGAIIFCAACAIIGLVAGDRAGGETIELQNGNKPDPLYDGIEDTWICSGYPSYNFGADDTLRLGWVHFVGGDESDSCRILIRPDFSVLGSNAAVNRVTLELTILDAPSVSSWTTPNIATTTAREYFSTSHVPWWGEGDNDWQAADQGEANWMCYKEGYTPDSSWCSWGASETSWYYEPGECGDRTPSMDEISTYPGVDVVHTFDVTRDWNFACYDSFDPSGYVLWDPMVEGMGRSMNAHCYASSEYPDATKRPKFIIDFTDTTTVRTGGGGMFMLGGVDDHSQRTSGALLPTTWSETTIAKKTVGIRICGIGDAHVGGHPPGGDLALDYAGRLEQLKQQFAWCSALDDPPAVAIFDVGDMVIDNTQNADYSEALDDHLSPSTTWEPVGGNWEPAQASGDSLGFKGLMEFDPPDNRVNPFWDGRMFRISEYGAGSLYLVTLSNVRGGFEGDECYVYGTPGAYTCCPADDGLHRPGSDQYSFVNWCATSLPGDSWKIGTAHNGVYGCEVYQSIRPNQREARHAGGYGAILEAGGFDLIVTGDQHVGYRTERIQAAVADSGGWPADSPMVYLDESSTVYLGVGGARDRMSDTPWWPRWYWDDPPDSIWRTGWFPDHKTGKPDSVMVARGYLINWYQGNLEYKHGQFTYREADTTTYVFDMVMNCTRAFCRIVDIGYNLAPETVLDQWVMVREGGNTVWNAPRAPREFVERDTLDDFEL